MDDLISIVVISYNSEKTIERTLKSIEKQTYKKIEIVISDDGSKDKTVKIIEEWKKKKESIFENIKIIKSSQNTGIPKNCNRGLKEVKGEYVKFIAGDDILLKDCIEKNYNFLKKNNKKICFSKMVWFYSNGEKLELEKIYYFKELTLKKTSKEQYKLMIRSPKNIAPTVFFKTDLLKEMKGFDESFSILEDYPMWLKILKNNIKIEFLNDITVLYRRNNSSITSQNKKYINELLYKDNSILHKRIIKKELFNLNLINLLYLYHKKILNYTYKKIIIRGNKKENFTKELKIIRLFSPIQWIELFKKLDIVYLTAKEKKEVENKI